MKLLIKGGRIIDSASGFDRVSNLLIRDGKIDCFTDEIVEADRTIDASGLIVSPGFIDMHMHEDPFDG